MHTINLQTSLAVFLVLASGTGNLRADLHLAQPTAHSVWQRDRQNQAAITVSGGFSGELTAIQARAVPRPPQAGKATNWQVVSAAPAEGKFSGKLVVGVGWYDLEVRGLRGDAAVDQITVEAVGVGEVFITAGQSNSANHGRPRQTADARVSARTAVTGNQWQPAHDPQPIATGKGGSPWPPLGGLLVQKYQVPVGFISVGVGSTTVAQWMPGAAHYERRLKPALQSFGPHGFRAILWHQGESDGLAKTSAETYATRLQAIIAQSRRDAGFDVPWVVALASYLPRSSPEQQAQVRQGQQRVIAADPLVFEGPTTDGFGPLRGLADGVHFNQRGLDLHAERWQLQLEQFFAATGHSDKSRDR